MIKKIIQTILAILTIYLPLAAQAVGVQVAPSHLEFQVQANKPELQNLTIVNPTADVQLFEVYSDDFTEIVKAAPASFTLEAGAKKTVSITVNPQALKEKSDQTLSTNLSVVGKPLADKQFSVGTGVKIPLTITFSASTASPKNNNWIFYSLAGLLVLGLGFYKIFKIKTKKNI